MRRLILCLLALVIVAPQSALAQRSKRDQKKQEEAKGDEASSDSKGSDKDKKKKDPFKDFDETVEEAEHMQGFYDIYKKPDALLLAIPKERLGEEFIMTFEVSQGLGRDVLNSGAMMSWEGNICVFQRHGNKIYLVQKPVRIVASHEDEQAMAENAIGASVLESADIVTIRKDDEAALIDVSKWFVSDISGVGLWLRHIVSTGPGPGRVQVDGSRSFVESVKVFPENVNVRTKLTFQPGEFPEHIETIADARYIPVSIYCVIAKLPETPMQPREADDRVGYFLTAMKDFSRDEPSFFTRYVRKWRLEPDKQRGELYEPKKPIIYYLDRNIPPELRPYVQAGITEWSLAFEAAGFKSAIQADLLPREVDAEDIRYPTVRWVATEVPSYGAIGPSTVDPRTGEILDADILFDANIVLSARYAYRKLVDPALLLQQMYDESAFHAGAQGACGLGAAGEALAMQGSLVHAMLTARGEIKPTDPVPLEFIGEFLKFVTMHEVGHTLGLRHNFRGSTDTPMERLHDRLWTAEKGVVNSVMEYPAPNIAPNGGPNGHYYTPTVGLYDRWAIAYGYTTDDAKAKEIARQGAAEGHAYSTDEDTGGPGALDPHANIWDLGADPLAWSKERTQIIRELWPQLVTNTLADNCAHYDLTNALNMLVFNYANSLVPAVKFVGGQNAYRDHMGDPNARDPFVPVAKVKQLDALEFVTDRAFSETSFDIPEDVLSQLGANRWSHWGNNQTYAGRIDYPLHEVVLGIQNFMLGQLLHPFRFSRISDSEAKFGAANVVTIPEMMGTLSEAIWSEVWGGSARNIPSMRRNLQRLHVDYMTAIVTNPPERMPPDARAVARMQLRSVKSHVQQALAAGTVDAYTKAHLTEVAERVDKAMEAGLEVEMMGGRVKAMTAAFSRGGPGPLVPLSYGGACPMPSARGSLANACDGPAPASRPEKPCSRGRSLFAIVSPAS